MPLLTLRVEFPDEAHRYYIKEELGGAIEDIRDGARKLDLIWDWDLDSEIVPEPEDYYEYRDSIQEDN